MQFLVVVPAHNEERWIGHGLATIAAARAQYAGAVETIVVANRCTDATAEIAQRMGARVVENGARNIAAVRNAGAAAATGAALVTIDADCLMAPNALLEIARLLQSGRFVGGGTKVVPSRSSAGIRATYALVRVMTLMTRLSGAMFWCDRADFDAVGGFDEGRILAEDLDFARRLRAHGRRTRRSFVELRAAPVVASTGSSTSSATGTCSRWRASCAQFEPGTKGSIPAAPLGTSSTSTPTRAGNGDRASCAGSGRLRVRRR